MKITPNEVRVLEAIRDSEYQDGNPVGHHVWSSYCNPFDNKRSYGGVMSSLKKKGLVTLGGSAADANYAAGCDGFTVALTQLGYDLTGAKPRS